MFGWFQSKKALPSNDPTHKIQEENFEDPSSVLHLFTSQTGIHFHQKEAVTISKLISFCHDHSIYSFEELYGRLVNDSALFEALINTLTINETYFFREMGQIDFLCRHLSQNPKPFRILCAPGSTGEEPYTIAISLIERGISPQKIEIISIDINSQATAKAISGEYSKRSLYKVPDSLKELYFNSFEDHYTIKNSLKGLVHFYQMNIFDEAFLRLGAFNAIFSRNMLIYFDGETSEKAISRLSQLANKEQCYFFFGHADLIHPPKGLREHYEEGVRYFTA